MGTTTKKRMKAKGVDDVANALTPILLLGKEDAHRLYADSLTRFLTESGLMKGKGERYMKPGGDTWKKRCSECEKEMYFGGKLHRYGGGSKIPRHVRRHCHNIVMNVIYHATHTVPYLAEKNNVPLMDAVSIFKTLIEDPSKFERELRAMWAERAESVEAEGKPGTQRFLAIYQEERQYREREKNVAEKQKKEKKGKGKGKGKKKKKKS